MRQTHSIPAALAVAGLLAAGAPAPVAEPAARDADVPVAPVAAAAFRGWTNAVRLSNRVCEVEIVPETGRLAQFAPAGGTNVLYLSDVWAGRSPFEPGLRNLMPSFGGEWVWPVAQRHWARLHEEGYRPIRLFGPAPWRARAWQAADGTEVCVLSQSYGRPLHCTVTRTLRLSRITPSLAIRQRLERTAASDLPATLWNVCQLTRPARLVLPRDSETPGGEPGLEDGALGLPPARTLAPVRGATVFTLAGSTAHRFAATSKRVWLAAEQNRMLVIVRPEALPDAAAGGAPAARLAVFVDNTLPYVEVETSGVETNLAPGQAVENALRLECFPCPAGLSAERLAERVRILLGETTPPPAAGAEGGRP